MASNSSSSWMDMREVDMEETLERDGRRREATRGESTRTVEDGVMEDICRDNYNASVIYTSEKEYSRDTYRGGEWCGLGTDMWCR